MYEVGQKVQWVGSPDAGVEDLMSCKSQLCVGTVVKRMEHDIQVKWDVVCDAHKQVFFDPWDTMLETAKPSWITLFVGETDKADEVTQNA